MNDVDQITINDLLKSLYEDQNLRCVPINRIITVWNQPAAPYLEYMERLKLLSLRATSSGQKVFYELTDSGKKLGKEFSSGQSPLIKYKYI